MSDSPAVHIGRPRLRDKMFETAADHGPLTAISASPPEGTTSQSRFGHCNSFDCIIDKEQRFSMEDCNWGHVKRNARIVRRCSALQVRRQLTGSLSAKRLVHGRPGVLDWDRI